MIKKSRAAKGRALMLASALFLPAACDATEPLPAEPASEGEIRWDEPLRIASGEAYQGPWRMNESRFLYVDDPTVAINDAGVVAVTWADQAGQDLFIQVFEADGEARLDEPVNVSGSPGVFSWLPRMAISDGDAERIYVLWQEILFTGGSHGGEILFARSTDGGRSFSKPENLSNTAAGAGKGRLGRAYWHNGSLDLAVGADGTIHAAWTAYEGPLWTSRSTDGGQRFSEPRRVAGDAKRPARGPSLAVDGDKTVYLAWTIGEDAAADIRVAASTDGGESFGEPRLVHPGDGHADAPAIAVDRDGTVHLVYAESARGPLRDYRILYARAADADAGFEPPREISGIHGSRFASLNFPALATAGQDRVHVLWELYSARNQRPRGLGLVYSNDGGERFTAPQIVPGSDDPAHGFNGSRQGLLMNKLAVNEAGRIAVVNSTFRTNDASHIWLFRDRLDEPADR